MTRIILVRHGQSEANANFIFAGHSDFPLTEFGHAQAKLVAEYLAKNEKIDAIYSSDLKRAYYTAVPTSELLGIEIVKAATQDADTLAKVNNITNMININADCVVGIDKALNKGKCGNFAIVLDPPRKGADQMVLNKVLDAGPNKIIYISCNPAL